MTQIRIEPHKSFFIYYRSIRLLHISYICPGAKLLKGWSLLFLKTRRDPDGTVGCKLNPLSLCHSFRSPTIVTQPLALSTKQTMNQCPRHNPRFNVFSYSEESDDPTAHSDRITFSSWSQLMTRRAGRDESSVLLTPSNVVYMPSPAFRFGGHIHGPLPMTEEEESHVRTTSDIIARALELVTKKGPSTRRGNESNSPATYRQ